MSYLCYPGHFKRQCKSPKKKNEDDSTNVVTEEVQDALLLAVDSPLEDWVLYSGTLFHTTLHREIIQNYVAGDFGKVYLADGLALDVVVLGDVRISLPNGSVWLLEKVTKGARVLARGKKTGTLYITSCLRDTIAVADARKQKKVSFLKTGRTSKAEKLELVHTDLWGPSPVASLGGSRYYITFIDDSSRKNSHEHARSMTLHARLPKTFWANAVSTAAYLINRGPSVPMEFRLPEEVWSGKEVKFSHLKVFGCVSYVHIDSDARSKLDAKSKICFFIGYGDEKFGYRSSRNIRPLQRYSPILNYLLLTDGGELECYDEALQDENSSKWELAMKDEMDSLLGNQTWELTELPVGKKALHNKWVYRIKNEHDGSKRYKARLVVNGFQQKEGIDYTEIFSPVVKMSTIRLVLGMVAAKNLHLEQLDVKTTFLHGDLEKDLYMIQPEGFIVQGQENLVCKLRKNLYGLKQAHKRSDIEKINNMKKQLSKQFAMKDLGAAKQILAKPVSTPLGSHFKLSKEQSPKTEEERDHMSKVPYASAIDSLIYAMVCTRPDITHAVGVVSRFMSRPGKQHWEGSVDADFAGDIDSRKKAKYVAATEAGKEMILHSDSQSWEFGLIPYTALVIIHVFSDEQRHTKSETPVQVDLPLPRMHRMIPHQELLYATGYFGEDNLIGKGSLGMVYKGVLSDGLIVAMKVFNLELQRAFKSFEVEYVASGLEYLHHDYSNPVVHCDLMGNEFMKRTKTLGTVGYMAPDEMFMEELTLKSWVESSTNNIMEVIDANLLTEEDESFSLKQACFSSIMTLALDCTAEPPEKRINMKDVVVRLKKLLNQIANLRTP
ncbi:Retrovirus-related Pol polyprotein from transposon TNT 1-94 [Vitis vinifera]|uniref:Retrovirus-related Pol polyprotein from transposon TNT 1-94 n=1 Tax=Vitis vinifera TaxID=29760 RepID=A0A438CI02_VITVI|nr:Retrovirus-related Pol polyprotein from transposon TNT 1-94 [Vitis vinifera]